MIPLFEIAGIPVFVSPFSLLPIVFALLAEKPGTLLLNLFALFLHELCHTFTANAMGYRILRIELQPIGFVARLKKRIPCRKDELAVAGAGPLFSLIAGSLSCFFADLFPTERSAALLHEFGNVNLFLGVFNLLPALPLDGGRMAESLFASLFRQKTAKKALFTSGFCIAGAFMILGIVLLLRKRGEDAIILIIIGCFLGLSVFREKKWLHMNRADCMLRRREQIINGTYVPIRTVAMHESTSCKEALLDTDLRFYTVIFVITDNLSVLGTVTETELFLKAAEFGQDLPISAAVKLR